MRRGFRVFCKMKVLRCKLILSVLHAFALNYFCNVDVERLAVGKTLPTNVVSGSVSLPPYLPFTLLRIYIYKIYYIYVAVSGV